MDVRKKLTYKLSYMTINTKYNIGDEVYAKGDYSKGIIQCEVQDLRASAVFIDPSPTIEYTLRYCDKGRLTLLHRLEEEIFPTKEELLERSRV